MFPKVRGWSSRMPLSWCILGLPHRSHRPLVSQESDQFNLDDNLASAASIRKHHVPHGVGGNRNRVASPRSCKSWCLVETIYASTGAWLVQMSISVRQLPSRKLHTGIKHHKTNLLYHVIIIYIVTSIYQPFRCFSIRVPGF